MAFSYKETNSSMLLSLPDELQLLILKSGLKITILENNILDVFNELSLYLKNILLICQKYRGFKQDLIRKINKRVKTYLQFFANDIVIDSQERQVDVDEKLASIIIGDYNIQDEIEAAKLIMSGANPNLFVRKECIHSHSCIMPIYDYIPILVMFVQAGKFKKLINLLVYKQTNLNIRSTGGYTPLMSAIIKEDYNIIEYLISHQVDINAKNELQETALMIAIRMRNLTIVNLLLKNGVDIYIKDKYQRDSLDIASVYGQADILNLLNDYKKRNNKGSLSEI